MTFGTTAGMLTASIIIYLAVGPLVGWTAECTARQCTCFGDDDCAALFESGQCVADTEVKSTTEMLSLCGVEAKRVVLGSCQQVPSFRNITISANKGGSLVAFPHLSKNCGG
jgi:hypothetical protein